jgi:hypothetical protein
MNNRLSIFSSYYGFLLDVDSYNKNYLFSNTGSMKKYANVCNLTNSKYISEVIDDGDKFKLVFKNPISPKYIHATCFEKLDEYGNSKLLKIRDEYLHKLSIKPIYGIWLRKEDNIDFRIGSSSYNSVLGENLETYDRNCHPNIKEWFCLGDLNDLSYYNGKDYIEYLINSLLLKPSYVKPFRRGDGNNTKLTIDGETLYFWLNEDDTETLDLLNENGSNITKETVMKYFEKPDIIVF